MTGPDREYPHGPFETAPSRAARVVPVATFALFFCFMSTGSSHSAWGSREESHLIWGVCCAWIAARITFWLYRLTESKNAELVVIWAVGAWVGTVAEGLILFGWANEMPISSAAIVRLCAVVMIDLAGLAYRALLRTVPAVKYRVRPAIPTNSPGAAIGKFLVVLAGLLIFTCLGEKKAHQWSVCQTRRSEILRLQIWYFEKHNKMVVGGKSAIELLYRDADLPIDASARCDQGGSYAFVKRADGSVVIECTCPDHFNVYDAWEQSLGRGEETITVP